MRWRSPRTREQKTSTPSFFDYTLFGQCQKGVLISTLVSYKAGMATASVTLSNGTKVNIEGNADEVATLLAKFAISIPDNNTATAQRTGRNRTRRKGQKGRPRREGPQTLIDQLAQEKFFKTKRTIGDVQKKLEEKGHIYSQQNLSGPLLRLTRDKHLLRRIKEKDGWVYVN